MGSTSTRRDARERALLLAYERELRRLDIDLLFEHLPAPPDPYAIELVRGEDAHRQEIDSLLTQFSQRWAVDRMPVVDRALLRIATYELGWQSDVDVAVIIDEAVELARQYSTEDSPRFVNGLLSRIATELRPDAAPAELASAPDVEGPVAGAPGDETLGQDTGSTPDGVPASGEVPRSDDVAPRSADAP